MTAINDNLFKISSIERNDGLIIATLDINKDCDIFKGHFPGQPVIPGACILQIVKEVLENALSASLRLKKADHLKFIVMIDPTTTCTLQLDLSYKHDTNVALKVTAKIINSEVICFKFQGTFVKE